MTIKDLTKKIESLPINAQNEVSDFVDFLIQKREIKRKRQSKITSRLVEDKFIGLWANREDLSNSSLWIRKLRETDWAS
jgi:hypothetical protein